MESRAAIIMLFLFVAPSTCRTLEQGIQSTLNLTVQQLRTETLDRVLGTLQADPTLFRNSLCRHLNSSELGEPEEPVFTASHLSSFCCYILKASELNQLNRLSSTLPLELKNISQYLDSMKEHISKGPACKDCSLPTLLDNHLVGYIKCLLQRLDQRLRNATFG